MLPIRKLSIFVFFPFLSAVFLRLSFPKPCLSFLAYVGLVPFLIVIFKARNARTAFLVGWIFGFCFYYSNIFWLNTLTTYNSFVPLGIFLMGIYLGLYGGIFGWLGFHLHKNFPRIAFITLPCLWVILEFVRNLGQLAFPWSFLSTTQWHILPLIQICDISGPWLLSFLIVLINTFIAQFVLIFMLHKSREKTSGERRNAVFPVKSLFPGASLIVILVILITGYGYLRLSSNFNGDTAIEIAVLQPDIPQKIKFASYAGSDEERENLSGILESINLEMLRELSNSELDLIIFPESAFTGHYFAYDAALQEKISVEAERLSAGILVGSDREEFYARNGKPAKTREEIEEVKAYNSAWYFLPSGKVYQETYDKIQLVPFGEHLPYFDLIPGFQRIIVQTGSFTKGTNHTLFPIRSNRAGEGAPRDYLFSSVICFESSFGWLLRRFAQKGADFLVVITNDGWYEDSAGPYQHFILSIMRAVETRRWLIRCSNRGISALISPRGEIYHRTELNQKATIQGKIYPRKNRSFYSIVGDWTILPYMIPLVAAILGVLRNRRIKRRSAGR